MKRFDRPTLRKLRLFLLCLVALGQATAAHALTPLQAQSLSISELSRLVLGEVGQTIVEVDRPTLRSHCGGGICPPVAPSLSPQDEAPPPLDDGLTFYQRPVPVLGESRPIALCSSLAIEVSYGSDGKFEQIRLGHRYGMPALSDRKLRADDESQFLARKAACARATAVKEFFQADDDDIAYQVVQASLLFRRLAERTQPLPFKLTCHTLYVSANPCSQLKLSQRIAARLAIQNYLAVEKRPCPASADGIARGVATTCYEIGLKTADEQFMVEMGPSIEKPRIVSIQYSLGMTVR